MKVLSVAHSLLSQSSTHGGGQTYAFYMKQICNDPNIDLRVICMSSDVNKTESFDGFSVEGTVLYTKGGVVRNVKRIIWDLYGIFRGKNALNSYFKYREYVIAMEKMKKEAYFPDIVILEWTQCVSLVDEVRRIFPQAKIIASEHDVMFLSFERKAALEKGHPIKYRNAQNKAHRIKIEEIHALLKCDLVMPHNLKDKRILINNGIPESKIHAINAYYHNYSNIERNDINHDVIFWGAMSRPENYHAAIWFIEHVMPRLEDTDIRFVVIGNNPHMSLIKYASKRVIITGFVEDPSEYFSHSLCLCAPLLVGAGIKIKIMEAMSAGIPVLTNEIGIEGIPGKRDIDYIHCNSMEDYENGIRELLFNENKRNALCENSKKLISSSFDLIQSGKNYIKMLYAVVG